MMDISKIYGHALFHSTLIYLTFFLISATILCYNEVSFLSEWKNSSFSMKLIYYMIFFDTTAFRGDIKIIRNLVNFQLFLSIFFKSCVCLVFSLGRLGEASAAKTRQRKVTGNILCESITLTAENIP